MSKTIDAVFKEGAFYPTQPIALLDGTCVKVTVPSEEQACDPDLAVKMLDELAALPVESPDDGFSGAEHDKILYPGPRR